MAPCYPEVVLDIYNDIRRMAFAYWVRPMSTEMTNRVNSDATKVRNEDMFIRLLNRGGEAIHARMKKEQFDRWGPNFREAVAMHHIRPSNG